MFVDVQGQLLYWMCCGWTDEFCGYVLDYGSYPDQKREYFTLRDAKRTLSSVHKGAGQEGVIYAGLSELCKQQLSREWQRDDGSVMRVTKCLIDANWGCEHGRGAPVLPAIGLQRRGDAQPRPVRGGVEHPV